MRLTQKIEDIRAALAGQPLEQPEMEYPYRAGTGWGFMRWMDIADASKPTHVYLRRLILFKTPLFAIYVHWIYVPDEDRDPHNHPMPFISYVAKGGYVERRWRRAPANFVRPEWGTIRRRGPHTFARITRRDFHSIKRLERTPTVTVLLCGPRSPEGWGFYLSDGSYVDQAVYVREKEERWAEMRGFPT